MHRAVVVHIAKHDIGVGNIVCNVPSENMQDIAYRASSWVYQHLPSIPSTGETTKAAEGSATRVSEAAKELSAKSFLVVGENPGYMFVRLAGLSGAMAVAFGAYGAHVFRPGKAEEELKVVGSLLSAGMLLFCGSCYYHALTGSTAIRRVTPYGGMLLIAAWAAMIL